MDAVGQVWSKLAQWFWRRRLFNAVNVFSLFSYCFPLKKGMALHLNKLESSSLKNAWCKVWLILAQWFWRKWTCEKHRDGWTDGQHSCDSSSLAKVQAIRKGYLNFQLRWTNNTNKGIRSIMAHSYTCMYNTNFHFFLFFILFLILVKNLNMHDFSFPVTWTPIK